MSAHPRHRRGPAPRRGRTRVLVVLGVVAVVCVGLSLRGTFAFWTGSSTATVGGFTTGTLDLTLDGSLKGEGGTLPASTSLTLSAMFPGDSVATNVAVKNAGDVGFTYTTSGSAAGTLATGLQVWVTTGAATNAGRTGSCGGSSGTDSSFTALNGTSTAVGLSRTLTPAATDTLCVVVRLDPNADSTLQGKSGSVTLLFNAKQVGA